MCVAFPCLNIPSYPSRPVRSRPAQVEKSSALRLLHEQLELSRRLHVLREGVPRAVVLLVEHSHLPEEVQLLSPPLEVLLGRAAGERRACFDVVAGVGAPPE